MTEKETQLVECIGSFLSQKAKLGLQKEPEKDGGYNDPRMRGYQYLHGQIDDLFAVKAAELVHYDGVKAAFAKIHNYKNLDAPLFCDAFDKEMISQGIPKAERLSAIKFIPAIIKELKEEVGDTDSPMGKSISPEDAYGFNVNISSIAKVSRPQQYGE